jgi:O-acetyl-ADP-ribose deacetylase (regulator of RNase III)
VTDTRIEVVQGDITEQEVDAVIHAAVMGQNLRIDGDTIRQTTINALKLAEQLKLRSLAFPAIGTGVGSVPLSDCARMMVQAVRERSGAPESMPMVRFVLFDDVALGAFKLVATAPSSSA